MKCCDPNVYFQKCLIMEFNRHINNELFKSCLCSRLNFSIIFVQENVYDEKNFGVVCLFGVFSLKCSNIMQIIRGYHKKIQKEKSEENKINMSQK